MSYIPLDALQTSLNDNVLTPLMVKTDAGDVTLTEDNHVIIINKATSEATTITLPIPTVTGRNFVIKDGKGNASIYNITLMPNGTEKIDGQDYIVLSVDYGSITVVWNGTQWNIL